MKIIFSCGGGGPMYPWADPNVEAGIGGSEECVILLARALSQRGHDVIVYNNCQSLAGEYNGVQYRDYVTQSDKEQADLLVAQRNWHLLESNNNVRHKWLYCHDIPVGCHCPCPNEINREDSAFKYIDKFVLLNDYHRRLYGHIPDEKVFVSPIGVDPETFPTHQTRIPHRVLYFSHPGRGLDRLREVWPEVRAAVPDATLASFWWEPEHFRPPNDELGILPMAHLGYKDIAVECTRADIFGYPSVFAPEISPATTIKAQFGGAVPVCVVQGGMVDTLNWGFYEGVTQENFAQTLIEALQRDLTDMRPGMMKWAREKYSWSTVAAQWEAECLTESTR